MEQSNVYQYALSWHVINSAPRVSAVWYSGASVEPEIQNDAFIRKILCMQSLPNASSIRARHMIVLDQCGN